MTKSLASAAGVGCLCLIGITFCAQSKRAQKTLTPAQKAEMQAGKDKACTTMNRLKDAGAFTKIEPGSSGVTHAFVDRAFFNIPLDAKESAMRAVALCYIDVEKQLQTGLVIVHDGYSGKVSV
jgi:hypothetical protein